MQNCPTENGLPCGGTNRDSWTMKHQTVEACCQSISYKCMAFGQVPCPDCQVGSAQADMTATADEDIEHHQVPRLFED